ncbi:10557_t:CDS:2 [Paraglomus occultum]|uniref:10557_t:CDS:1 n=1 Tax=Paraglomus occultum TaxID=144539 RepID=A0A9N9DDC4_9GLOM|nr:10557_t:CDS:2 [Paraglomus occultum]
MHITQNFKPFPNHRTNELPSNTCLAMELYSEISRLALTEEETTDLYVYFTTNPAQKEEAVAILEACKNDAARGERESWKSLALSQKVCSKRDHRARCIWKIFVVDQTEENQPLVDHVVMKEFVSFHAPRAAGKSTHMLQLANQLESGIRIDGRLKKYECF